MDPNTLTSITEKVATWWLMPMPFGHIPLLAIIYHDLPIGWNNL
jgi:hypothetical protein